MVTASDSDFRRYGQMIAGGLAVLGVALLAASFLVSPVAVSSSAWTRTDAEAFSKSAQEAKSLAHQKSHGKPITEAQVRDAIATHDAHYARFEQAKRRGTLLVTALRWSGVAATLAAVIGYARTRSST